METGPDVHALCRQGPICPAPDRICHSHWMSHIPFAFWLTEILRPRIFVELGAYAGASFCAFCQQIASLGFACEAYAIDTWQGDANMGAYPETVYAELADYVQARYAGFASLIRSSFLDSLSQFGDKSIDLLHIDGYHSAEAMLGDFEMWLPKMSERGVVLLHDIKARLPGYGGVEAWQKISSRFPAFAFRHGYGLGLILTGNEAPAPLVELTRLPGPEAEAFANRFQQQGRIYERLFRLEQERQGEAATAREQAAQAAERELQAAAEQSELRRLLESERLMRFNERDQLREQLQQATLTAKAYEDSLSWKLTAPLRKLSRLFRA